MSRLLIAEDDPAIRTLFEMALAESDFEIEVAADGPTAIESIRHRPPDFLITDFMLPGADGLEICQTLQLAVQSDVIPALIITGSNVATDRLTTALKIPGVMIVTKPVRVTALEPLLHALSRHWHNDRPEAEQEVQTIASKAVDKERLLPGENPETDSHHEASRWLAAYGNLINFKQFMLEQTSRVIKEDAGDAANELRQTDLPFLEHEMQRLKARRSFWQQKVNELT